MPSAPASFTCPECGASCIAPGGRCWLCRAEQPVMAEVVADAAVARPPTFVAGEVASAVVCGLILLVAALIGIGLAAQDPGMLVPYLIVVVPALAATLVRGAARRMEGRPLSWTQRLITLLISASATVGLLALVCMALVAAFFVYCVAAMTNM